ncbi:MAG: diguanylate cyclase [Ruminiclostridium sp.]|nr:diguanylate cyclase [Ruminiclostridium sp.]
MKPLKKIISKYMYLTTFVLVVAIVIVLTAIQLFTEQRRAVDSSHLTLHQIEHVLEENRTELSEIEAEYRNTCINNSDAVAEILDGNPDYLNNIDMLKKVAEMIEIDEIHIFDKSGKIYSGTHPQYYGLTFDSGEQMAFFKPMLNDKSMKLVQDVTPNTAEEKPMQYSAVWSKNKEYIVQIGMEPVNVLKVTQKNELSYIFSLFRVSVDANYYAIDGDTHKVVGSTKTEAVGQDASAIGLDMKKIKNDPDGFHATVDGSHSFCIFKESEGIYIGRIVSSSILYQRVPTTAFWTTLSLLVIAFLLAKIVVYYMDNYVVKGIRSVNKSLQAISAGDLMTTVDVRNSSELAELSDYINAMKKSLLKNNKQMSYVLSKTELHIGIFEYDDKRRNVVYTELLPEILGTDEENMKKISADSDRFREFIDEICKDAVPDENSTFRLGDRYIRLEETEEDGNIFGVVLDVTESVNKRRKIELERDIDVLTEIYNRRGLDNKLTEVFADREELGRSAVIMIDADGLKKINDTYGHEKGDVYLKKIAKVINNYGIKNSIAARQGGDEFVLFLYGYDSDDELLRAIATLEYIQNNSMATLEKGLTVPMRFSMGYCLVGDRTDYQTLFKEADENMYKNKAKRKSEIR